jgi:DegV family protein with EDD domain
MSNIAIVTDSTCDLTKDLVQKHNITVVPLIVLFGEEQFLDDGESITLKEFYEKIKTFPTLPKTTQPSPGDFIKVYRKLLESNDSIISIHLSKKMSGTIASAEMAKKEFKDSDIEIIDSEVVHMPLGFMALEAVIMANEGKSKEEILKKINYIRTKLKILFVPSTLEYLKKGGRIGRSKALLASLLEIKPILTLKFGEVSPFKNTRRWNQAKNELIDSIESMSENPENLVISVSDSATKEEGDEMAERIKEKYNPKKIYRTDIGCVVGTHLGPGGIAISFYEE